MNPPGKAQKIATADEDRVPLKQKFAYSSGLIADHYAQFGVAWLALPVYNILLGISPQLVTTALALARLWDAITDPVVGSISDNLKSRFGRRKPLIFVGAILTGIAFPLVWMVPEAWGETATFVYLCVAFLIFYTCYSLFSVPYESLGMELTPDYQERTRVYSIRFYISAFADLGLPFLFWMGSLAIFTSHLAGVRLVSVGVGILIAATGIWCDGMRRTVQDDRREAGQRGNIPCARIAGEKRPPGDHCQLDIDLPVCRHEHAGARAVRAYLLHLRR